MKLSFITPQSPISCPRLWKEFSCASPEKAELTITGLGLYRAFLNGERVGQDYLTPGFNDYDAYLRVQVYDVTAMIKENNRLEVWMGNGWYKGRLGFRGGKENRWGEKYLLAARLTVTLKDGSSMEISTGADWQAAASPIISGNIYDGEVRDDTLQAAPALPCKVVDTAYKLEKQFSPCIRIKAEIKPTLIHTPADEQVLDFGQNMAGVIRFVNRLPKGKEIRIQTGEVLQGGNFYRENLRSAKSEFVYKSDGIIKDVEPMFTFFGFRYAKVEGLEQVNPDDFTAVCLSSALKETLKVSTGSEKLNRLLENSLWGQRSNFLDVPTDCPQRDERLGWTADTQVFMNTACYQMDCKDFYRKFMRDMRSDQRLYYQGDIPAFSPSLKGEAIHGGAVWADSGTIIPWNLYMNYGDEALLRESYPMMRDYTEYLINADKTTGGSHIVFNSFTFGDWLALDGMTPLSLKGGTDDAFIQGVYYYNSVNLTAKAAGVLKETEDEARYGALAEQIKEALLDEYLSPNGNLTVDTQTGYVLALYYGIYRDKKKLLRGFGRRLQRDFFRITCGFTGVSLILPVLLDNGLKDVAYRMLLTEEFPGWLYAVKLGATTIWERWNSLEPDGAVSKTGMNSLNHYAYGSVCEAVYSRIMGLKNAAPGWVKATIAPKIDSRLKEAQIRFDSPAGRWLVHWKIRKDGTLILHAEVPKNATAHVVLSDHPQGLEVDVASGIWEWEWTPVADYLHPFSTNCRIMDLMDNDDAAQIVKQHAPALYAASLDKNSETRALTPVQAAYIARLDQQTIRNLDLALRSVAI